MEEIFSCKFWFKDAPFKRFVHYPVHVINELHISLRK